MKVFIDTNIFTEYIFDREQSASVQKLFQAIKENDHRVLVLAMCV